jgi:hypothetical protein
MKIEDCKVGMKVTSKENPYVKFYIITKVFKTTVWVSSSGYVYKGILPSVFTPIQEED